MGAILVLTPVLAPLLTPLVVSSWAAVSTAVAGAALAMGLTIKKSVQEEVQTTVREREADKVAAKRSVEIELTQGEILQNVATDQEIVLTKGTIELRVRRDTRGRCAICAKGRGHSEAELRAIAEEFTQRMTQCFVYNRVMTELKAKGFQVVNEEQMRDETVRIHVRRWEA